MPPPPSVVVEGAEGLEDALAVVGGDAGALVVHLEPEPVAGAAGA